MSEWRKANAIREAGGVASRGGLVQANHFVAQAQVGFAILPSHHFRRGQVEIKKQEAMTAIGPSAQILPPSKKTGAVIFQQLVVNKIGPGQVALGNGKQKGIQVT